jgi:hypothetical protein
MTLDCEPTSRPYCTTRPGGKSWLFPPTWRAACCHCPTPAIGFVSHDGSDRRRRQPCRPLSTAVCAGIGFVFPGPSPSPICHNSFPTRHLLFASRREELALFRTFRSSGSGTGDPAGPGLSRPARGNWLCFAQFAAVGGLPEPARSRPSRSWQGNWLRLYQRSRRRPRRRPRPSASVARGGLASFRTPSFGVPRLRGPDWSFPPEGGTPNGPRSPPGSLFLWGRSLTMAHTGPLTTKPSKVVVSCLSSAILLLGYHMDM